MIDLSYTDKMLQRRLNRKQLGFLAIAVPVMLAWAIFFAPDPIEIEAEAGFETCMNGSC